MPTAHNVMLIFGIIFFLSNYNTINQPNQVLFQYAGIDTKQTMDYDIPLLLVPNAYSAFNYNNGLFGLSKMGMGKEQSVITSVNLLPDDIQFIAKE